MKAKKSLNEIAAEEMTRIFTMETLAAAFKEAGYSNRVARKEASKRASGFLGPIGYSPRCVLRVREKD